MLPNPIRFDFPAQAPQMSETQSFFGASANLDCDCIHSFCSKIRYLADKVSYQYENSCNLKFTPPSFSKSKNREIGFAFFKYFGST